MEESSPYRLRPDYLSAIEKEFFQFLLRNFSGNYIVTTKVALTDIVTVVKPNENVQFAQKIQKKVVDFLLLKATDLDPVLAIELDDPKQEAHGSTARLVDDVCAAAGLPILHIVMAPFFDIEPIQNKLDAIMVEARSKETNEDEFSPICPNCGITMVLRFDKQGPINGNKYYGCLNYPDCVEKIPVG